MEPISPRRRLPRAVTTFRLLDGPGDPENAQLSHALNSC
jgi:hypothetical protein